MLGGLCALAVIDWRTYRLPNPLTYGLITLGVFQSIILDTLTLQDSLIGAVTGYSAFVMIEWGFKRLRGIDGLGRGDAKLLAAGGAWCGWWGLPFIVLIASGTGLLMAFLPSFRTQFNSGKIPFGPFLALGIAIVWLSLQLSAV